MRWIIRRLVDGTPGKLIAGARTLSKAREIGQSWLAQQPREYREVIVTNCQTQRDVRVPRPRGR